MDSAISILFLKTGRPCTAIKRRGRAEEVAAEVAFSAGNGRG